MRYSGVFYAFERFMQIKLWSFSWFGRGFWLVKIIWYCIREFRKISELISSSSANISSTRRITGKSSWELIYSISIILSPRSNIFISPRDRYDSTGISCSSLSIRNPQSSRWGPICVCPVKISRSRFSRRYFSIKDCESSVSIQLLS